MFRGKSGPTRSRAKWPKTTTRTLESPLKPVPPTLCACCSLRARAASGLLTKQSGSSGLSRATICCTSSRSTRNWKPSPTGEESIRNSAGVAQRTPRTRRNNLCLCVLCGLCARPLEIHPSSGEPHEFAQKLHPNEEQSPPGIAHRSRLHRQQDSHRYVMGDLMLHIPLHGNLQLFGIRQGKAFRQNTRLRQELPVALRHLQNAVVAPQPVGPKLRREFHGIRKRVIPGGPRGPVFAPR